MANVKIAVFVVMLTLLCACTPPTASRVAKETGAVSQDSEADDIREAVFRYQFDHNGSGLKTNAAGYYLEIETTEGANTDPDDAFLKRFANNKPSVRKRSDARVAMEECENQRKDQEIPFMSPLSQNCNDFGVIDRRSGRQGLIFYQDSLKRISETKAEVSGGYYEGGESSSGNTYTVEKQNGKWIVTNKVTRWIS